LKKDKEKLKEEKEKEISGLKEENKQHKEDNNKLKEEKDKDIS
jgi:hypothetical protein